MANFVETANLVVTLLEELETTAKSGGEKLLAGVPKIESQASKGKQHAKELDEALTSLEQRVAKTREKSFARIGELKTKLAKMHFSMDGFSESIKQDMEQREKMVGDLDERVEILNTDVQTLAGEVTKGLGDATTSLNYSNDAIKLDFDKIEKQLEKGEDVLDELHSNFERELQEVSDFVEDRCIRATEVNTDQTQTELKALTNQWQEQMEATIKLLTEDLNAAVERIQAAETEARADVQEIVQEVEQAYDGEMIDAAGEKAQQKTQEMSQRMTQSRSRFDEAVDTFGELLEVMKKMVE